MSYPGRDVRRDWVLSLTRLGTRILAQGGALLVCAACAVNPTASGNRVIDQDRIDAHHGGFLLNRPLHDLYDSALVMTIPTAATPLAVSTDSLAESLLPYDVVFFGEIHGHTGVHLAQLRLLRALTERDAHIVLSMEQFERDVQGVVDDYLANRIGERALIMRGRAWENYASSYRPLLMYARDHGLPVIAAEAPGWSISCIGQYGADVLDQFTTQERAWVASDLHVTAGAYRDKFRRFESDNPNHGGGGTNGLEAQRKSERAFTAQVARDDTMAESIFLARKKYPGRRIVQLNGNFHSEGFLGTVERLRLRDPSVRIAVIDAIEVGNPQTPSFTAEQRNGATALQLVYPTPAAFVENEDQSDWIRDMISKRKASACKYSVPSIDTAGVHGPASVGAPAAPATAAH